MTTKGALGNLINRYAAVLKKCRIINTFGSLAAAALLLASIAAPAMAVENMFDDFIPADPDFVVSSGADVGPPKTTHNLAEDQTRHFLGRGFRRRHSRRRLCRRKQSQRRKSRLRLGEILRKRRLRRRHGGKTGTSFTLTNYGSIFVDGTSASATKGMGVNPDGKAVNEGLIAVRKGSAMTDNSGSASKTLVNKNVISVEDAGGVASSTARKTSPPAKSPPRRHPRPQRRRRRRHHQRQERRSLPQQVLHQLRPHHGRRKQRRHPRLRHRQRHRQPRRQQPRGRPHQPPGQEQQSHDRRRGLQKRENLYVKGSFGGEISNHSNINFTDNSQISLDDSLTIDNTSGVTLVNTSLVRGQNSPESALFLVNDEKTAVNGGMSTRGTASVERMESRDGRVSLKGAVVGDNAFVAQNEGQPVGVVSASLADGRSLDIDRSLFSGNSLKASAGVSSLGGAVVSVSGSEKSRVSIANSDFIGNSVSASEGRGGAIFNNGTALSITDSSFKNNHASSKGGAIFNSKAAVSPSTA